MLITKSICRQKEKITQSKLGCDRMRLIECVPNFSEGRRKEVIDAIVNEIKKVESVKLLDVESDKDHNRSVVTFIGEPEAVKEAMMNAAAKAIELIDMNKHTGEHPRIGAVDVIPFVPLYGITMAECVELAREFAKEYAERFNIPVYLYAEAALKPYRKVLANIRQGEFEALKEELGVKPERDPDFGPKKIHPTAGATVIGARDFLIAFNVNLNTNDKKIADRIARALRESTGAIKNLQALGIMIKERDIAQVSMNILNYKRTPLHLVFENVKREAQRYGVNVIGSEIIGLVPLPAVIKTVQYYLQTEIFDDKSILDLYLYPGVLKKTLVDYPLPEFVDLVASNKAVPGGGSVSALLGSLSAALASMFSGITMRGRKYGHLKEEFSELRHKADLLRGRLLELVNEDAEAFRAVLKAMKLPEGAERDKAVKEAYDKAISVPLETMEKALESLKLLKKMVEKGNPRAITDSGVGAIAAYAAMEGAALNVKINLTSISDENKVKELSEKVSKLLNEGKKLKEEILSIVDKRMTES